MIDIEEDYKTRVVNIWQKFKDINVFKEAGYEYRKSPILPKLVKRNAILFIGINPAFSKNGENTIKNRAIEFYPIASENNKDIPYFEKFKDIAEYCDNADWTHLDLFFMRETNQKVVEKLSHDNVEFLQAQLDIAFEIIDRAMPQIIIVSNSLASEFFGKRKQKHLPYFEKIWMGFDLDFDKDFDNQIGTYKINVGGKDTPIIFSGMLSGQRALDIGSLERLKWQIKMILDKEN